MNSVWLALGGMMLSIPLSGGGFPKPLTAQEEQICLIRASEGDVQARNTLIERNLRLVAHIMNNG